MSNIVDPLSDGKPANHIAVEFLEIIHPGGPWWLERFAEQGKPPIAEKCLTASDVATFLAKGGDQYFVPGELAFEPKNKTPSKDEMKGSRVLWGEFDPPDDVKADAAKLAAWRAATERELRSPKGVMPHLIVDSGRGFWVYWLLAEVLTDKAMVEALNIHLGAQLGLLADKCHNINRIARLPGTVNGKTGATANVVLSRDMPPYKLDELPKVEPIKEKATAGNLSAVTVDYGAFSDRLLDIVRDLKPGEKSGDNTGSAWEFDFACNALRDGHSPEVVFSVMMDTEYALGKYVQSKGGARHARHTVANAFKQVSGERVLIRPGDQSSVAESFIDHEHPYLIHFQGEFLTYDLAGYYRLMQDATVEAELLAFLRECDCMQLAGKTDDGKPILERGRYVPSDKQFNAFKRMLTRVAHVAETAMPSWRDGAGPDPRLIVSCSNGLLNVATGDLLPHTPDFLTRTAVPIVYDPAATCPLWMEKIGEWFRGQPVEQQCLQEWFGLCLTSEMKYHKAVLLKGMKRSGKGTIADILRQLIGERNVASPSVRGLSGEFGLSALVAKTLAILADARIDNAGTALAEDLLRIIGGDTVDVNRKNKAFLTNVAMMCRFMILSNVLPKFKDSSGVVASRFIPIIMHHSWFGKEDTSLKHRLHAELPGILNWAMEGLRRLTERGHFVLSPEQLQAIDDMEANASPLRAFIRDCCLIDTDAAVTKEAIWTVYMEWCVAESRPPLARNSFFTQLADVSEFTEFKPRNETGKQERALRGIGLLDGSGTVTDRRDACQGVADPWAMYRDKPCHGANCMRPNGTLCPRRAKGAPETAPKQSEIPF